MNSRWQKRPPNSNWGDFGADDQRGRMNWVTKEKVLQGVAEVKEGLTFFCLHFNAPGELDLIEPRSAYIRTEEYELFRDQSFRDWLDAQDIDIIGMKPLREELRARLGRSTPAKARKAATRSAL